MPSATGLDCSHWQGTVDWGRVKASGCAFAAVKATQGTGYTDPAFARNWAGMKAAGLIRIAYHFDDAGDATSQANRFYSTVKPEKTDIMCLDWENVQGPTWALTVLDRLAVLHPGPVICYTGHWYTNIKGTVPGLAKYALWIASYTTSAPVIPTPWQTWTFWQHSDRGTVPGVGGTVDTDYFHGDTAALKAFVGSSPPPPPPPPPTEEDEFMPAMTAAQQQAMAFQFGKERATNGGKRPTEYTGSDSKDYTTAAQRGFDIAVAEAKHMGITLPPPVA